MFCNCVVMNGKYTYWQVVIILQYIQVSNYYVVDWKLIYCCISIIL